MLHLHTLKRQKKKAKLRGVEDRISYLQADFMDEAEGIMNHDIVVLDKVLCCYPHMDKLIAGLNIPPAGDSK